MNPTQYGSDPRLLQQELLWSINAAIQNQPRSLQKAIGPSEIGDPCDRCLALKLAGQTPQPEAQGGAWLPYIGTAVHAQLADVFDAHDRWLVEQRVDVGMIAGAIISGSADLFDPVTGTVIDWKVVGKTTLDKARRHGPTDVYRAQAHLYGRGFTNAGHHVERVAIYYLPRNAINLGAGHFWSEPYDEQVAVNALKRAEALHAAVTTLGLEVTDRLHTEPGCRTCPRFPRADGAPWLSPHIKPSEDPADPFGLGA